MSQDNRSIPMINPYTASRLNISKNFKQINKVNINANVFDQPTQGLKNLDFPSSDYPKTYKYRKQSTTSASETFPDINLDGVRHI